MTHKLLYLTAPNGDVAREIARTLLEARLIACANILDGATSLYRWEGKIQEEGEALMIAKTDAGHVETVIETVKAIHPYDCPCVVSVAIENGNSLFLEWITKETSSFK